MTEGQDSFPMIAKKKSNKERREMLANNAPNLAREVACDVKDLLIELIVEPLLQEGSLGLLGKLEVILRQVYRQLDGKRRAIRTGPCPLQLAELHAHDLHAMSRHGRLHYKEGHLEPREARRLRGEALMSGRSVVTCFMKQITFSC